MSLESKLFRGDRALEAAAVLDSAHVTPGSAGPHVLKIQAALTLLDAAIITLDEVERALYGPSTAHSVLAYKQKRNIINRSYQTQADNIVGKMTIASLDREMLKHEALPHQPIQIKPAARARVRPPRPPDLASMITGTPTLRLGFAVGAAAVGPSIIPNPGLTGAVVIGPTVVLEMPRNSVADIVVSDGLFGEVVVADPTIVKIRQDALVAPGERALVVADPQTFKVHSGKVLGSTIITASTLRFVDGSSASIEVVVKNFFDPPKFVEGVNHNHTPSGRYADVKANPNSPGFTGGILGTACQFTDEIGLVNLAKRVVFSDKPIATKHLDWYLKDGNGRDFIEDDNIRDWLRRDQGIRKRLKREIFPLGRRPKAEGHFEFLQGEFAEDPAGQDFRFAFGSIDRVDYQVDLSHDTVRFFFKDRYEWHPFYPFYVAKSGDIVRETNCLHAALVELKTSGAADFWMVGQGEIELSLISKS
jgi:hypothetical protein